MKTIKRLTVLVCMLCAVNACSCDKKANTTVSDKNKTKQIEYPINDVPEDIDEGNPSKAYCNLIALADKQLIDTRHLNGNLEYVSGLVSLEYTTNRIIFCALGDKQDDCDCLVKITMNHTFELPGDFVYQMTNLKLNSAVSTYGVSCEVMYIYHNEAINDKFDESKLETLTNFDESKIYNHLAYRADGSSDTFFSVTYVDTDLKIHSINAMEYNNATDDFTIASEYRVSRSDSEKMYELMECLLTF